MLGFCCSCIGLGASNTRPLSRPKARAPTRAFSCTADLYHAGPRLPGLAGGPGPGFFRVRADFPTEKAEPVLVRSYLLLSTCTYPWCLSDFESWCLVVQNSPDSQDFVENTGRSGPQEPPFGVRRPATRVRPSRGILEPTSRPSRQSLRLSSLHEAQLRRRDARGRWQR